MGSISGCGDLYRSQLSHRTVPHPTVSSLGTSPLLSNIAYPLSAVLPVLLIVATVNAVNMVDGVDGLAGGVVTVSLVWLWVGCRLLDLQDLQTTIVYLIVPTVAFLGFNVRLPWRPAASVFMGDAGTMMLGFAVAWLCIELSRHGLSILGCCLV